MVRLPSAHASTPALFAARLQPPLPDRVLPGWVHGTLALVALGMNIVTGIVALQCIAENVTLIDEIDEALPEDAGE